MAQDQDAQRRQAAMSLAQDADNAYNRSDWPAALDLYTRASALSSVPYLLVRKGECLEKVGRLVEALDAYTLASQYQIKPDLDAERRKVHETAMAKAVERVGVLRGRVGKVDIQILGDNVAGAEVYVDNRQIPPVLVGTAFPVDPGKRVVQVKKGERTVSQTVDVSEASTVRVSLTLPPGKEPEGESNSGADVSLGSQSSQTTWGWVALGVGAAGVVTGTVTGIVVASKNSSLSDACQGGHCTNKQSEVDSFNRLRPIPVVGFAVGAVGIGAGLALLFTAPKPQANETAGVRPWVGIGSLGVEGTFK